MTTNIKLLLVGLVLLYLSSISLEGITFFGVIPNLLLAWVIYVSYRLDYKYCVSFSFFIGLGYDILTPQMLGLNAIIFVLYSYFINKYKIYFNNDKVLSVSFSIFLLTLIFYVLKCFFYVLIIMEPLTLIWKTAISALLNTLLSIVLVYIIFFIDRLRFYYSE